MAKSAKSVFVYSDIHVGSKVAVCSESPEIIDAENYTPNPAQKALFKGWREIIDSYKTKPDILVINGESIDGSNPKSMGSGVWSTDLKDQINDFKKLLNYIPKPKQIYFVRGSGYHVQTGGATNIDEIVASEVNAQKYRTYAGSGYTDYEANIEVNGKIFNFTHHVGFAEWEQYRTTALARELVKLHFEHSKRGHHTDIAVRSHVHYYVEVRFKHTIGVTSPAWKFPDSFMYRRGIPTTSDIGCIEFVIESNGEVLIYPHIVEVMHKPKVIHYK